MSDQNKMNLVKETLSFVVKQLKAADRLAIVTYDEHIETALPLTPMNSDGKTRANEVVKSIQPRGSTDLCSGLLKGMETNKNRSGDKNMVASTLLFTDGLANHGVTQTDKIVSAMGTDNGFSVHTFGFGNDHDANMLKAIADGGSGVYFYLKDKDDIPDAFSDCLGGLLSVVGQNISLTLEGINGYQLTKVMTKFKTSSSNGIFTVQIGDIQSEEERDILFNVKTSSLDQPKDGDGIVKATLSYFNVITSRQCEASANLSIHRPATVLNVNINYKVDLQRNRITAADAITEARQTADKGDMKAGRAIIEAAKVRLQNSLSKEDAFTKALLADLQKTLDGMQDQRSYTTYGNKYMNAMESAHHQQRSAGTTVSPVYETSSRMTSKAFYKQ